MARHTETSQQTCELCDYKGTEQQLAGHMLGRHKKGLKAGKEVSREKSKGNQEGPGKDHQDRELFLGGTTMAKIVESSSCPTCGTKHSTVQKFEIPEVGIVDQESVAKILSGFEDIKSLAKSPGQDVGVLKAGIDKGNKLLESLAQAFIKHPKPTQAFIDDAWENCPECKEAWEAMKEKIRGQAVNPHIVSPEHLKDCPECQKAIADMLQPPAPAPAPAPAPPGPAPVEATGEAPKPEEATERETKYPWEDKEDKEA